MRIGLLFLLSVLLFKNSTAQVSLQTGSAVFSLPVYNWQDNNSRLNAVIALNYNSGNGLKVDEAASDVGQGWGLIAGGVITRLQAGEPDDQQPKDVNDPSYGIIRYPAGFLYNQESTSQGCPAAMADYPIYTSENVVYSEKNSIKADREQDYFNFQINGRTGVFILDKANRTQAQVLGDSKLIVRYEESDMTSQGIRTTISTFTIQDENGLIYRFSKRGLTKILKNKSADLVTMNSAGNAYSATSPAQYFFFNSVNQEAMFDELPQQANPFVVNNWYLSEIEDVLNHKKIFFSYVTRNIDTYTGRVFTYLQNLQTGNNQQYITALYKRSLTTDFSLSQISFPDGYNVNFGYSTDERSDIKGGYALHSITVNFQSSVVFNYILVQQYLGQILANRPTRLYLSQIKRYGFDNNNYESTSFEYYTNSGSGTADDFIPPLYFEFKDAWGYYNGDHDGVDPNGTHTGYADLAGGYADFGKLIFHSSQFNSIPSDQIVSDYNPKVNYAKIGLLKKITNPSGGTITYEYAQNEGSVTRPAGSIGGAGSIGPYYGGVHVSRVTNSSGSTESKDVLTDYSYINSDGQSSLWGMELPNTRMSIANHFTMEGKNGSFGFCSYDYKYPGILSQESAVPKYKASAFNSGLTFAKNFAIGQTVDYIIPSYGIFSFVINWAKSCSVEAAVMNSTLNIVQNQNEISTNPMPLQFKRVESRISSPGIQMGKTVYEFTGRDEFPDGLVTGLPDPYYGSYRTSRQRSLPWGFGLPKLITSFDGAGNKVSQTENVYDFSKAIVALPAAGFKSCHCEVAINNSKNSPDWQAENPGSEYITTGYYVGAGLKVNVQLYDHYTGRVELTDSYQRYFKDDTHYQEMHTKYSYNSSNYQVSKTEASLTNGDTRISEVYYPSDYTMSGVLQSLKNNNIVNAPVASYSSIIKYGQTQPIYLGGNVTDFSVLPNGDIKSSRIMDGRTTQPLSTYSFDATNSLNFPNLVPTQLFSYDADGNLVNTKDEGGRSSSLIYDYNGKYVVASVANAEPGEIAYASFETSSGGNWTITEGTYVVEAYNQAVTGNQSFDFHSNNRLVNTSITKSGLSSQKHYFISYWSKDGSVNLATDGTATSNGPAYSYNGWSLYINEISNATSLNITGTGKIDELRLYPKGALMSTTTFDPVLGKTSECDPNNRITYYSYNNFGELEMVLDQERNALKTYEYRNKNRTHQ